MREWTTRHLTPLWRQFACAEDVRVMFGVQQDASGPNIPLMLAITYRDTDAMAKGLASSARYTSRDLLPEFYERFFDDVTLWHYVMQPAPAEG